MRICILCYRYEDPDAPLARESLPYDPTVYLGGHTAEMVYLTKRTAVRQLVGLAREGYNVFLNLCDGSWDGEAPGIEVVQALERLDVPFTGAVSTFYEPSREAMKRVCHAWGVKAPASVPIRRPGDVERAAETLRFPLIVKHPNSYSSIGITRASRVETPEALREQVEQMASAYGGALVEEFVEGDEYTVLVAEDPDDPEQPTAYVPIGYVFPEGETFKHYDLKWVDYHGLHARPCTDPDLAERLKEAARRLFVGLGGTGYGRCDLRVDAAGEVWMLEINPNCAIFYPPSDPGSADLILQHDPAGHRGFVEQILAAALARHRRNRRPWEVRADREGSYGTFAVEPVAAGEVVQRYEEQPHVLVTRSHVERHWDERRKGWFARYAWPLTDEVWVMWSDDPEDWRPVNHACDPNAWLDGLDLVARRPIAAGEEITVDYATFYNEAMPDFACACGASSCRETVRGTDHLGPFAVPYGEHVSDYVRARRSEGVVVGEAGGGRAG